MKLPFCAVCGRKHNLEHHHFIPRSQGGKDHNINMLTLCVKCHGVIHGMQGSKARFTADIKNLQAAGIAKAKAEGKYKGRKPTAKAQSDRVRELKANGMGASAIAKELGIGRASVYRILENA